MEHNPRLLLARYPQISSLWGHFSFEYSIKTYCKLTYRGKQRPHPSTDPSEGLHIS